MVFVSGVASAILAWLASTTQHNYYKNVRDLKAKLEQRIGLGDLAIATTTGMGGARWRLGRITTFQKLILLALLTADVAGLGTAVAQTASSDPPAKVEVVVQMEPSHRHPPSVGAVVFSRGEQIVASVESRPGAVVVVRLPAGGYRLSALGRRLCTRRVIVTAKPLQRLIVHCP